MNKKILALLLQGVMVTSVFAGCNKPADTKPAGETGKSGATVPDAQNKVVVGNTTEATGDYGGFWQNNATDSFIYGLINGYATSTVTFDGKIETDKVVVKEVKDVKNPDGTKTFTFTLNENLVWDDGTKITAKDYVANVLLFSHKIIEECKGKPTYGNRFVGYSDFNKGKVKEFTGVRLLGDYQFSVQLDKEFVPSFFELSDVATSPLKLDFWLKSDKAKVEVKDDGKGAYLSGDLTVANFKDSIDKARKATTRPSSGPYKLAKWDPTSLTTVLEKNDKYLGESDGTKPSIKTIIVQKTSKDTQMQAFQKGELDILENMMSGDEINAGLNLINQKPEAYKKVTYPRSGYGKLQFVCDFGPTQFKEVRQGIAHLLNRTDFAKTFTGGFGTVVHGPYGEGMWQYKESKDELNEKLNQYQYSKEEAMKLFDKAGYNLDSKGQPWKLNPAAKKDSPNLRYRKNEKGALEPLIIEWSSSEKNPVSELLVTKLVENPDVAIAGMKINQTQMTFQELLAYANRESSGGGKYAEKKYHMFNLASSLGAAYAPFDDYTTDPEKVAQAYNTNFILDKDLERVSQAYWKVDAKDRDAYRKGWVEYIIKWNELLPDLPLYSNILHDFVSGKVEGYKRSAFVGLGYSLLRAKVVAK